MRVALLGQDSPVARATRLLLEDRGHTLDQGPPDCVIYFPGAPSELERIVAENRRARLVLRSHAYAYGSSPKNPGFVTEERGSLLPDRAPARRWLEMEAIAAKHPACAAVRLTNVLAPEEGDLLVRQISRPFAMALAGRDPNVQFLGVEDAAGALVAAAESGATGIFNAAGEGAIPLTKAYRASRAFRIPVLKALARQSALGASIEQLEYNWTVSSDRAQRELGWRASRTSGQALADFAAANSGAPRPAELDCDGWGLDVDYIRRWGPWFWFLRKVYWRIEHEGIENVPAAGSAIFVSNHRGLMPLDAVMLLSLFFTERLRVPRFLIIHSLLRIPFLSNFLTKLGGVIACRQNARLLLEAGNLVGIFPEGIRGSFTPYGQTFRLRDFSKSAFALMAIENQAPIVPAAVIGHSEIFPIVGRINWSYLTRELGWPYLPIAPPFPLAPIPLPSKWHVRVLPPIGLQGLKPADAENPRLVKQFSSHIQQQIQSNLDEMRARRKHIFWGRIFDGSRPDRFAIRPSGAPGKTI